eukprot:2568146-Prymnesium_polylepis.2
MFERADTGESGVGPRGALRLQVEHVDSRRRSGQLSKLDDTRQSLRRRRSTTAPTCLHVARAVRL